MNYGAALRLLRDSSAVSTEEIANVLGVSRANVYTREERTKRPSDKDLEAYSRLYDVSVETIEKLAEEIDSDFEGDRSLVDQYKIISYEELQQRIKQFAYLLNCTPDDILKAAKVTFNGLKNRRVNVKTFKKIAAVLGIPSKDFVKASNSALDLAVKYDIQHTSQLATEDSPALEYLRLHTTSLRVVDNDFKQASLADVYVRKLQDMETPKVFRMMQLLQMFDAYKEASDVDNDEAKAFIHMLEEVPARTEVIS